MGDNAFFHIGKTFDVFCPCSRLYIKRRFEAFVNVIEI